MSTSENKDEPSAIDFIDKILIDASKKHASDIHFEPYEELYRIRFRIDGLLYEIIKTNTLSESRINTRLKIMANLDIAEKRFPQDGRFIFKFNNKSIDCRLSTCPTIFGEKLVVRILNPVNNMLDINYLEFSKNQIDIFNKYIKKPQGLILVTGPTGSGKTLTMYTALNILNQPTKNISTVEDPIEINLDGINQVEVNNKIGMNFAIILRAFLRQDPDIIMIGEIRDLETAEIAIKAAQTGHLVFATMHTNSAAASLTRLIDIGIPKFNLNGALSLIVSQRLLRRLCSHCKQKTTRSFYQAYGCSKCNKGYLGRIAVFEMLPINPTINDIIMKQEGSPACELEKQMKKLEIKTLRQAAFDKVYAGITSTEEVSRVIL